ncbi:5'-hydroxyaverantin dehydrogenase [Erysiphe neolycopersici]|uniref:5'-hydroxyaverantin dehydrogenase n=1 Tax=Erysiphe neolycopersici TaxID=212602 RepID=A0A420HPQ1_9PEZI|nr:5'-hydroxyaverantin dehydrogenase [Erysiphe neolycopersici]
MPHKIVEATQLSNPIDLSESYDPTWLKGKTIIITGGASGFGAAFSRHWASHGAHIIIADINDEQGKALAEGLRKVSPHTHFIYCDVTNWKSQVNMFREAARLSPTSSIDAVVANAGILNSLPGFGETGDLDQDDPPKPAFKVLDVNLIGVLYTAKLATFWLQKNTVIERDLSSLSSPSEQRENRDKHLLLIGSVASIAGLPILEYTISKHAVLGLFRTMRATSFMQGIRVNILMPYFIDTPIVPTTARLLLAGGGLGKEEDVVDAGTRLMADKRIRGRSLVIGPKVYIDEDWQLTSENSIDGNPVAVWEAFAHEHEHVDIFTARFIGLLKRIEAMRGWVGWMTDIARALFYPFRKWFKAGY